MSKIPVYFYAGLAASTAIFERIQLPEADFEVHLLEWEIRWLRIFGRLCQKNCRKSKRKSSSDRSFFGGILVQEMAKLYL
jgi:hypothetical protein